MSLTSNIFNQNIKSSVIQQQIYIDDILEDLKNITTDSVAEGGNLYYSQARFDTAFSNKSTSDLKEGTNLYYTTARSNTDFDTRLATKSTTNLAEGSNLYYTTARANTDFDTRLATKSTTNLTEGTNLYYTDARARAALSAGQGIDYDNTTGIISSTFIGSFTLYFNNNTIGSYAIYRELDFTADGGGSSNLTGAELATDNFTIGFITQNNHPDVSFINAGTWFISTFAKGNNNITGSSFYYKLFKVALDNTETLLFTSETTSIISLVQHVYITTLEVSNTIILNTDRLLLKLYTNSTSNNRTITFYYDGSTATQVTTTLPMMTIDYNYPLSISGGVVSFGHNTTNLKITSNQLNTIQDISTGSSPTFSGLTVTGLSGLLNANAGVLGAASIGSGLSYSYPTLSNSGVLSITGTSGQITASASTGSVTLSIPSTLSVSKISASSDVVGKTLSSIFGVSIGTTLDVTGTTTLNTSLSGVLNAISGVVGAASIGSGLSYSHPTLSNSGVLSITGTSSQVIASSSTGAVTLSLPQSIATSSNVQFATIYGTTFQAISPSSGSEAAPCYSFSEDTDTGMYRDTLDVLKFSTGGSKRFEISNSLITCVPAVKLSSLSTGILHSDSSGNLTSSGIISASDGKASSPSYSFSSDGDTGMYNSASNELSFSTGGTQKMKIDSAGTLHVGDTSTTSTTLQMNSATTGSGAIYFYDGAASGYVAYSHLFDVLDIYSVASMRLFCTTLYMPHLANGTMSIINGTGLVSTSSDRRLKQNIEYFEDNKESSLTKILQLKPCSYTWKDDTTDRKEEGFIAQDVEQFLPYAVDGKKHEYMPIVDEKTKEPVLLDGKIQDDLTKPRYRGLNQTSIIAHLVRAVQELTARLTALENA